MGYYFCGILTGILFCVMVLLVRCAVWFEIRHPEEDYWHRNAMKRDGPEERSWFPQQMFLSSPAPEKVGRAIRRIREADPGLQYLPL